MALNRLRGLPYFEQKPFIQQAAALASKIKPLNDRNQEEEQQDDSNTLARIPVETQQAMIPALLDQATKSDSSANETEKETASVKQQKKKKRKNQITDEQKEKIKAYLDGQKITYDEEDFKSTKNLRDAIYSQLDGETKKEVAKHIEEILKPNVARNNKTGNAAKTKPEYDISIYLLRSNNAKKTENPETNKPQEPLKDWEKRKEEQMKVFDSIKDSIKIPGCTPKAIEKLKSIFENLFKKGLQSGEYSFYTVPLNEEIINKTFDIISKSEGSLEFHTAYKKAVFEYQQSKFDEWGISKEPAIDDKGNEIGYFITIPQTQEDNPNFVNRYNVIQTHSHDGWCIHQCMAPVYLENHNNVFYIPHEGSRKIGFTYTGNTIAKIQTLENHGIEKGNSEEIFKILFYNEWLLKDLSCSTYINLYEKLNEAQNVDAAIQLTKTYLTNLTSDENLTKTLTGNDLETLNETFANNDKIQEILNKVNNAYFKAITTQIQNAENEGRKVTDVLSTEGLRSLNETFSDSNMAANIQSVNNLYFKTLTTQIQNAANKEQLAGVLDVAQLVSLNILYKQENKPESLNALNNAYFEAITTQIQNAENKEQLAGVLSEVQLLNLNHLYKKENKPESLNALNNAYFEAITTQIQNAENEEKVTDVSNIDLVSLNRLYKQENKPESLNALNNAYFEAITTQIQKAENEGKVTDVLSTYGLRYLNETFSDSDMAANIQSVNNAYFKAITTQIQKAENEGKVTDVLSISDLIYLKHLYKQENKQESFNALNITYLKTLLAQNIKDVCNKNDLEILNLVFKRSQDQQIQDLLRQINAKMESAQG